MVFSLYTLFSFPPDSYTGERFLHGITPSHHHFVGLLRVWGATDVLNIESTCSPPLRDSAQLTGPCGYVTLSARGTWLITSFPFLICPGLADLWLRYPCHLFGYGIREGRFSVPARHAILEAPCTKVLAVITSSLAHHSILYWYSNWRPNWHNCRYLTVESYTQCSWHQLAYTHGTS